MGESSIPRLGVQYVRGFLFAGVYLGAGGSGASRKEGGIVMWDSATVDENVNSLKFASVGEDIGFSTAPCWACERHLGGDRVELNYIGDDGEQYTEEICVECAMYIANGEEPEDN